MYVPKEAGMDDPDEPHIADQAGPGDDVPLYSNTESRDEVAALVAEEIALQHVTSQQPIDLEHSMHIDTAKLSTIAQAILQALEAHEEELRILQRHELVLCSPNPALDAVETQKQFDAYRDHYVMVETVDPFESNRTLKGRLVDRNAMDVLINVQGRLVTIPHNFVKVVRVRLPGRKNAMEDPELGDIDGDLDYDDDDDDEVEDDEEEDEEARP
jgi:ribosome maturation factor RimP